MPNLIKKTFDKMNIDQSFKAFKLDELKLVYKVKFDNQKKHEKKQYGYSMTKASPTGCIKENKTFHGSILIFYRNC